MKYKIEKGTTLYKKLIELKARMDQCHKEANELCNAFGSINYYQLKDKLAGGIQSIQFHEPRPNWHRVGDKWQKMYAPDTKNTTDLAKLAALPVIEGSELNALLEFKPEMIFTEKGNAFVKWPGFYLAKSCILVNITKGSKYKPIEDLEKISGAQWLKLRKV